ncbi:MAG: DUF3168 domain-containing protein [Pseudomonadota bacterium]
MSHPMIDLQKAVYARLSSDATLTAMVGPDAMFDRLVENEQFPYLAMGRATYADWSTSTDDGAELVITTHIWDRSQSRERTVKILNRVSELLADDLSLDDHRIVVQQIEFAEVRRQPDSQDFHGLVRLRAKMEALATAA